MPETNWQRSSYCGNGGNNCVEISVNGEYIAIRDSIAPERVIITSDHAFRNLTSSIKSGDLPS
jgi:hypothetical protein